MVRLNPVTLRIVNQISIPRETITTIEIEAEIAHYYAPTELVLKLDEMDMKAIKIIGMSDMVTWNLRRDYNYWVKSAPEDSSWMSSLLTAGTTRCGESKSSTKN